MSKKAVVEIHFQREGYSGSTKSVPLKDRKLVDYLRDLNRQQGRIVIEHITEDNRIQMTDVESVEFNAKEDRISEIEGVIRDYINNAAIDMDAFVVTCPEGVAGVFGKESSARLQKKRLARQFDKNEIHIEPIKVNSFNHLETSKEPQKEQ